jgi:hypothetical protein
MVLVAEIEAVPNDRATGRTTLIVRINPPFMPPTPPRYLRFVRWCAGAFHFGECISFQALIGRMG